MSKSKKSVQFVKPIDDMVSEHQIDEIPMPAALIQEHQIRMEEKYFVADSALNCTTGIKSKGERLNDSDVIGGRSTLDALYAAGKLIKE